MVLEVRRKECEERKATTAEVNGGSSGCKCRHGNSMQSDKDEGTENLGTVGEQGPKALRASAQRIYESTLMGSMHHCLVSILVHGLKELLSAEGQSVCAADSSAAPSPDVRLW